MNYARFILTVLISTVIMYGLMYLNTFELDHIWFSQTRVWMALIMGSSMCIIMLVSMAAMYKNKRANLIILLSSVTIFGISMWLLRSQETVGDISYMKAMIPHHSIAIMTSERAHIRDPRVRELADGIIEAQLHEIAEMEQLISDIEHNGISNDESVSGSAKPPSN